MGRKSFGRGSPPASTGLCKVVPKSLWRVSTSPCCGEAVISEGGGVGGEPWREEIPTVLDTQLPRESICPALAAQSARSLLAGSFPHFVLPCTLGSRLSFPPKVAIPQGLEDFR